MMKKYGTKKSFFRPQGQSMYFDKDGAWTADIEQDFVAVFVCSKALNGAALPDPIL